jgi:hypothetical protein
MLQEFHLDAGNHFDDDKTFTVGNPRGEERPGCGTGLGGGWYENVFRYFSQPPSLLLHF